MNDNDTLLKAALPTDDEYAAASSAHPHGPRSLKSSRRTRALACCGVTLTLLIVTVIALFAELHRLRHSTYRLGMCVPLEVHSDGACTYLIVGYDTNHTRRACGVVASIAERSSFGSAPACFAPDADESELDQAERVENERDTQLWRSLANTSTPIECAIPTNEVAIASAARCAELTTRDGYVDAASREWNERLVFVAQSAQALRHAIDATTSALASAAGWTLGLVILLTTAVFMWACGARIDRACTHAVEPPSAHPAVRLERVRRTHRNAERRQD